MTSQLDDLLIAHYPIWQSLSSTIRHRLAHELSVINLPAHYTLFEEGMPCPGFPLLLSGEVRVVKTSPNGREIPLYRVLPGEWCVMSSMCLFNQNHYPARGLTISATEMVIVPPALFDTLMDSAPFRRAIFQLFGERLNDLMQLVEQVVFYKLDERLALLLLGRGKFIDTTHQQLADELGSVREMVSRLLKNFSERGWVKLSRESIEILNPKALRHLSEKI